MGRPFTAAEDRPDQAHVALMSHALWVRRFNSDQQILGKTIELSGEPHVIIGIVGPGFDFGEFGPQPELYIPFQIDPQTSDQGHYFQAAGRLKAGVTLDQANARLKLSAAEYQAAVSDRHCTTTARLARGCCRMNSSPTSAPRSGSCWARLRWCC